MAARTALPKPYAVPMTDLIIGILAIGVGLLLCFFGAYAMRFVIAVWGAFVGFTLGAGLIASFWDDGFLAHASGWLVGLLFAVVFSALAYLYYWVAVLLATAAFGFAVGAALMGALGVSWNWVIILVAVLASIALGVAAIVTDLPHLLLIVLSTLAGASTTVTGLMLLTGAVDAADFTDPDVTTNVPHDWWWYVIYVALVFSGLVAQSRRRWDDTAWRSTSP